MTNAADSLTFSERQPIGAVRKILDATFYTYSVSIDEDVIWIDILNVFSAAERTRSALRLSKTLEPNSASGQKSIQLRAEAFLLDKAAQLLHTINTQ